MKYFISRKPPHDPEVTDDYNTVGNGMPIETAYFLAREELAELRVALILEANLLESDSPEVAARMRAAARGSAGRVYSGLEGYFTARAEALPEGSSRLAIENSLS